MKFTIWLTKSRTAALEKPDANQIRGILEIAPQSAGAQIQKARDLGYEPTDSVLRKVETMKEAERMLSKYSAGLDEQIIWDYFSVACGNEASGAEIANEADYVLEHLWTRWDNDDFRSVAMDVIRGAACHADECAVNRTAKFLGITNTDELLCLVDGHFDGDRGVLPLPSDCSDALNRAVAEAGEQRRDEDG